MEETLINEYEKETKSPPKQQKSRPQSGIPRLSGPPSLSESVNLGGQLKNLRQSYQQKTLV